MNIQYIYTLFKLITRYRAIKWYRVADNLSRYLRVIIGPSIWRPSIRWYREKNGTIDDGSRIRRLYTLSLSLRLSILGFSGRISNIYPRTITIVRMVQWNNRSNNRSRGVESMAGEEISPKTNIALRESSRNRDDRISLPWDGARYRDYIWPKRRKRSLTQDGDGG